MKKATTLLFILFCLAMQAQNDWQTGYYVDDFGKRHDGLVRSADLENLNSSNAFLGFKDDAAGTVQKISTNHISETGLNGDTKSRKFSIALDNSDYNNVTTLESKPQYIETEAFLNVILEGDASLFVYESDSGYKYFFTVKGLVSKPEQLFYKRYLTVSGPGAITREVSEFRLQLQKNVSCTDDPFAKFSKLEYKKNDLVQIFESFNKCHGGQEVTKYQNLKKSRITFLFSILGYARFADFHVRSADPDPGSTHATSVGFGVETEVLSRRKKFGYLLRVTYGNLDFKTSETHLLETSSITVQTNTYGAKFSSTDIQTGARYHFSVLTAHDVFVNGMLGFAIQKGVLTHSGHNVVTGAEEPFAFDDHHPPVAAYLVFGGGYTFKHHYSVAVQYESPKSLTEEDMTQKYSYNNFVATLAYTF
jgi:hypothetical protein